MNKLLLLALVLMLCATVCLTGCTGNGPTNDKANADTKKQTDADGGSTVKKAEKTKDTAPTEARKLQDLIVGKWEGPEFKGLPCAVEFTPFGTAIAVYPNRGSGKYLMRDNGELVLEFQSGQQVETQRCKVTIENGQLTIAHLEDGSKDESPVRTGSYKPVTSFSKTPPKLLIGKWRNEGFGDWEFLADGTFSCGSFNTGRALGKYKVSGDSLDLLFSGAFGFWDWDKKTEQEKTRRVTFSVTQNELSIGGFSMQGTLADSDGISVSNVRTATRTFDPQKLKRVRDEK